MLVMGSYTKAMLQILIGNSPKNFFWISESVISITFHSPRRLKDIFIDSRSHSSVKPLVLLMI